MKFSVKNMAFAAICAASSFVLDYFSIRATNDIKITLYALPLVLCSIFIGFKSGLLAGLVEGIISQFIFPIYPITKATPLWLIAPILWGLLPGLIQSLFKERKLYISIICIIITCLIVTPTNMLVSYLDGLINEYGVSYAALTVMWKFIWSLISGAIYSGIVVASYKPLSRYFNN